MGKISIELIDHNTIALPTKNKRAQFHKKLSSFVPQAGTTPRKQMKQNII